MDAVATTAFRGPHSLIRVKAYDPAATTLAAELHARALREDDALTQDVFGTADQIGAEHHERRIKSLPSLEAAILRRRQQGVYAAAASIDDLLVYYVVYDGAVFDSRYYATLLALKRQGHSVVKERSYWKEGNRHQGTHVSLVSRNGMPFEIQFHTPSSLAFKRLSDALYAMYRDPTETSSRRIWAEEQNRMLLGQVEMPMDLQLLGVQHKKPKTNLKP